MAENLKLTAKQMRFCEEYLVDSCGAQAAIRAGYSRNGAKESAHRLLTLVHVQQYLNDLRSKVLASTFLTLAERRLLLREIAESPKSKPIEKVKAIELDAKLAGDLDERTQINLVLGDEMISRLAGVSRLAQQECHQRLQLPEVILPTVDPEPDSENP